MRPTELVSSTSPSTTSPWPRRALRGDSGGPNARPTRSLPRVPPARRGRPPPRWRATIPFPSASSPAPGCAFSPARPPAPRARKATSMRPGKSPSAGADAVVPGGHSFASGAAVRIEQGSTGELPVDVPATWTPRRGAAVDRKAWLRTAEGRTRRRRSRRPCGPDTP